MKPKRPGGTSYRDQTIRLTDLAESSNDIRNVTFENCVISGPAVLALQDCSLTNCVFQGNDEALFWDVGDRRSVLGAIALVECTIIDCQFSRIGLLGTPACIERMRTQIGFR